jgi:hypothetical protein
VKQHLLLLRFIDLYLLERLRTLLQSLRAAQVNLLLDKKEGWSILAQLPLTLPEPLVDPHFRHFPGRRKWAMRGLEAAEEKVADN